jgi:hypothetical protein
MQTRAQREYLMKNLFNFKCIADNLFFPVQFIQ